MTGYSPYLMGQITNRYNAERPQGMSDHRHSTSYRPPLALNSEQQEELR